MFNIRLHSLRQYQNYRLCLQSKYPCQFVNVCLTLQLNSGHSIPAIGLGVYEAEPKDCYNAVLIALEAGYRHIDSAAWYGNEDAVGRAVSKWIQTSGGKREDVSTSLKCRVDGHRFSLQLSSGIRIMGSGKPVQLLMLPLPNGAMDILICT